MGRRGGLGRGLGALIPTTPTGSVPDAAAVVELPLDAIVPNPRQPRSRFDEAALEELAASIRLLGVLQPVLVRPAGPAPSGPDASGPVEPGPQYELVAGERRWRASQRAGLERIPAIVRSIDDRTSVEQALVENLQRADLGPLDEAAAYHQLMEDFELTQDQVADRVGKSRPTVANTLRLLRLPPGVLVLVDEGSLSAGHARALLALEDPEEQQVVAELAVAQHWTVRRVEEEVRRREAAGARGPRPRPASATRAPALLELESLLSDHLDTRVQVSLTRRRGRMVIEFGSIEDLERIYRAMVHGREGDEPDVET